MRCPRATRPEDLPRDGRPSMFLQYYGFREQPFGVTPNPRYLYQSPTHREALASLIYAIENDLGFTALVAEPGMGKTTLLFHLLEKLRDTARTAFIFQTQCTMRELLNYVMAELEIPVAQDSLVSVHEHFRDALLREAQSGRRVVIIIDEAQNLSPSVLETVRLLSDFETPETKLLHIILSGQPQLANLLGSPELAQLKQRIAIFCELKRLNPEQVQGYIQHRLKVAGHCKGEVFTREGMERIAELSGGIPREINRICFNALSLACALHTPCVTEPVVSEVGNDLDITALLRARGAEELDPEPHETKAQPVPPAQTARVAAVAPTAQVPPTRPAPKPTANSVRTNVPVNAAAPAIPAAGSPGVRTTTATPVQPPRMSGPAVAQRPMPKGVLVRRGQRPASPAPAPKIYMQPQQRRSTAAKLIVVLVLSALLFGGWYWLDGKAKQQHLPAVSQPVRAATPAAQPEQPGSKPAELPKEKESVVPPVGSTPAPAAGSNTENPRPISSSAQASQRRDLEPRRTVTSARLRPVGRRQEIQRSTDSSHNDVTTRVKDAQGTKAGAAATASAIAHPSAAELKPGSSPGAAPEQAQGSADSESAYLISKIAPSYPTYARENHIQGPVILNAHIGKDGKVTDVKRLSGNAYLADAAADAVRQWVYKPYKMNGKPVETDSIVVIQFSLGNHE